MTPADVLLAAAVVLGGLGLFLRLSTLRRRP